LAVKSLICSVTVLTVGENPAWLLLLLQDQKTRGKDDGAELGLMLSSVFVFMLLTCVSAYCCCRRTKRRAARMMVLSLAVSQAPMQP
jgi:hypothetical protein